MEQKHAKDAKKARAALLGFLCVLLFIRLGMNSDPTSLDRLHDIVAPPPLPWWPPAPGWYYVIVLLLIGVLVLVVRAFIRSQRNRYRREALAEVARLEQCLVDPAKRPVALATMAELLKRAAITAFSRGLVASLTGPAWFDFLDRTGGTKAFTCGVGAKLEAVVYDPAGAAAMDEPEALSLARHVKHWLRKHDVKLLDEGYPLSGRYHEAPQALPITNNQ